MTNPTRISGIGSCTGDPDTGKTRLFMEVAPLARIALFHDDTKRPPSIDKLGLFYDIAKECKGLKMMEMGQKIADKLAKIKQGEFDAIIFDTWTKTEQALRYWGKEHAGDFREAITFSPMGKMKNGEQWKEGDKYVGRVINEMASKAAFVGLITHLKEGNQAGEKTGKMIPDCSKILDTACNFRVWLRKNPGSGVPIGLVLKRFAEDRISDDGYLKTVNILPWKVTPRQEDESLWDTVDYYRANPYGNRQAEGDESPDEFELSILTNTLTPTQRLIWETNIRNRIRDEAQENVEQVSMLFDQQTMALQLKGEGLDLGEIVEKLEAAWPDAIDLGLIMKWIA